MSLNFGGESSATELRNAMTFEPEKSQEAFSGDHSHRLKIEPVPQRGPLAYRVTRGKSRRGFVLVVLGSLGGTLYEADRLE